MTSSRIISPNPGLYLVGPDGSCTSVPVGGGRGGAPDPGHQIPSPSAHGVPIGGGTKDSSETAADSPPCSSMPSTCSTPPTASPPVPTESGSARKLRGRVEIQCALVAVIYLDVEVGSITDSREIAVRSPAVAEWQATTQAAARALRDALLAPATALASGLVVIRQIADCEPELLVSQPPPEDGGDDARQT